MTHLRDLSRDTRGAALVLGIAMSAFVAYFLWQLMSVADAIIYRERMQEAADSTAFESAVMHARTMNLLSALNIFMAAVLSILVMLRLLEMILAIAIAVLFALSAIPFLAWLSGPATTLTNFEARLLAREPMIVRNVTRWLTRLNKAERTISSTAPLIDVTVPMAKSAAYFHDPVNGSFAVGFSVVPAIDKVLPGTGPRMALSAATPAMPIEEGSYDVLCKHAAEFWPKSFSDGLRKAHADGLADVLSGVANFLGAIASLAPSLFCGGPDQLQATADKAASGAAKQVCDSKKGEADKNKQKFDYNKCMKDQTKIIKVNSTMPRVNPAAVWSSAHNGNIFFQVWSITNGEPPEVPTLKFGKVEDKESYHWAVAQAEFFSDCEDGEAMWAVCEPLAMWRLKWKARVRRVIDPVTAFEMEVKGLIADAPAMLLDTAIQKVIGAATKNASGISGELWASALQTGGGMLTQILSGKLPDTSALADRLPFPEHERLIIH